MTILKLIKRSAMLLNIDDVVDEIDAYESSLSSISTLKENKSFCRMLEFAKIVISEINERMGITYECTCLSGDNKINYSVIDWCIGRIISVRDENGNYVNFQLLDGFIIVEQDGTYVVKYTCSPNFSDINVDIDICRRGISEELVINGLNSYYCLATGLYNEFNIYNEHYIDGLNRVNRLRLFALPCRSWNE